MPDNKNSKIIPFAFDENLIRTVTDESGNIWFVAKDVCRVLGIENNRDAIAGLDEDEKITVANPDGNPSRPPRGGGIEINNPRQR